MEIRARKVVRVSRKKLVIFILAVIVILGFIFLKEQDRYRYNTLTLPAEMGSGGSVSAPALPVVDSTFYPNQYGTSSVKDTREFMKVAYGADIKTRDVKAAMRDVKNAINDANGRVDSLNETPKYSYVSFVIPKSNFSNFKNEIENITNEKLITENTSSQNLLGQKQSIEQQTEAANNSLSLLLQKQKDLIAKHTQTANSLQKQLQSTRDQLAAVRTEISTTSDPNKLTTLRNQEYTLSRQEISLQQNLNSESSNYANDNQNLKNQIDTANLQIQNIKKEDVNFTDNVETVNGYVSVNWIDLWDLATILSPIHPAIIVIIVLLFGWYYLTRKNYLPHFELA
jgi:hypothetical protein